MEHLFAALNNDFARIDTIEDYLGPPIYDDYSEDYALLSGKILLDVGQAAAVQRASTHTISGDEFSLVEESHSWLPKTSNVMVNGDLLVFMFKSIGVIYGKINVKHKATADLRRRKVLFDEASSDSRTNCFEAEENDGE